MLLRAKLKKCNAPIKNSNKKTMFLCGKTTPQLKIQRFIQLSKSVFRKLEARYVFSRSFQSQRKSVPITLRFSESINTNKENPLHQRSAKRTRFIRVPTTTASRTSASVILVPKTSSRTIKISRTNAIIIKITPQLKFQRFIQLSKSVFRKSVFRKSITIRVPKKQNP